MLVSMTQEFHISKAQLKFRHLRGRRIQKCWVLWIYLHFHVDDVTLFCLKGALHNCININKTPCENCKCREWNLMAPECDPIYQKYSIQLVFLTKAFLWIERTTVLILLGRAIYRLCPLKKIHILFRVYLVRKVLGVFYLMPNYTNYFELRKMKTQRSVKRVLNQGVEDWGLD